MDYAEALRACTENGADPDVLFGAADEIERLRRDALRYHWLRGGADVPQHSTRWPRWEVRNWDGQHWQTLFAEHMDDAIDAAMSDDAVVWPPGD